jgi:hypothetical protein
VIGAVVLLDILVVRRARHDRFTNLTRWLITFLSSFVLPTVNCTYDGTRGAAIVDEVIGRVTFKSVAEQPVVGSQECTTRPIAVDDVFGSLSRVRVTVGLVRAG